MKTIDGNSYPPGKRPALLRLLDRIFAYESMSGAGACPVYLERWTIALRFNCGVYLHHFLGDDWAVDPHDHPRRFISIGLRGFYWEDIYHNPAIDPAAEIVGETKLIQTRRFQAPWFRSFPADHLHRVRAAECGNVWTLVIVLPKSRGWGFVQDGKWIPFREYVFGGKSRKSC